MEKQHLYQPFEVEYKEMNEDPIVEHKHNFFEMVFIMEGTGVQCVNDHKFNYGSDHFMLMFPNDCHAFQVKTTTRFFFIRFNNIYLQAQHREWIQKLEFIFQNHNHLPGCLLKNKSDKILVRAMVDAIIREQVNQQAYHRDLIQQIINTLITVVARNITFAASLPSKKKINPSMEMVNYINEHIYDPEKLKAEVIARHFSISPSYISEYFKTHNGESLQQYILNYRLKLVEIRLKHSEKRISEIALELGFTDESHMNRLFKKYKGSSPSEFRKSAQAVA